MGIQGNVTLDDTTRIGQGRTAEIFAWERGRVLRLFRRKTPREWARHELEVYRSVSRTEIPSPAVHPAETSDGLIEIDGRFGFVMDRIDGRSMLQVVAVRPWRLWRYARDFAELHCTMHDMVAHGLPSQAERFRRIVDRVQDTVGSEIAEHVQGMIEAMGNGDVVCHGDFHPDNVLMSDRGPVVIDWGPATSGSSAADVAWTVYLLRHGAPPPGTGSLRRLLFALLRSRFLSAYRRAYLRGSGLRWSEVVRWGPLIAVIRLGDGIPEEEEALLRIVGKAFRDCIGRTATGRAPDERRVPAEEGHGRE